MMVLGQEPRQTTSNLGHLQKPSVQALIHGLNRHYYSISINYRKNELEQKMLLNLHKKSWMDGLMLADYVEHCKLNETTCSDMLDLAKNYNKVKIQDLVFVKLINNIQILIFFLFIFFRHLKKKKK